MPSYTPGLDYIVAVIDALLLKLRLGDETTDAAVIGVCVGSPEGVVTGSPGDIRIALPGGSGGVGIWQKDSGEMTETGWVEISGSAIAALLADHFVVYQGGDADLTNARVITAGTNVTIDLTTPGQVIVNAVAGGGGTSLQTAITNQGAVPTTQGFSTRIQSNSGFGWEFEDQSGNDIVTISSDNVATAFAVQGGNTAAGAGQAISLTAGTATAATQAGGTIGLQAGTGNTTGAGGSLNLFAGQGGATGQGGQTTILGGAGGTTSGNGGAAVLQGGAPTDGNGGSVTIAGRNAATTTAANRNGGSVSILGGLATLAGTGGNVAVVAGGGGATGTAGAVAITGGAAGTTSGASGAVTIQSAPSVSGATGSVTISTGVATGGVAGDVVLRPGSGSTNGRVLAQPVWSGDGQMIALVGNGANSSTIGLHAGSRSGGPNGVVSGSPGSYYGLNQSGTAGPGQAWINIGTTDPSTDWAQLMTSGDVTLQLAITNQSTTPTSQNFDTSIGLTGASWFFLDNLGQGLVTINDGAALAVSLTGQQATTGQGQDISISGGLALAASGQRGGDVVLRGLAGDGAARPGMVRISSAWALDSTISPAALSSGNNNNYAPTNGTLSNTWRLTPNAAGSTITGITGGQAGRKIELFNLSTGTVIVLTNNDTGNSTAANCFLLPNSTSVTIPPLGSITLWYDTTSSRWRADSVSGNAVTLQNAIDGQSTTLTSQNFDTGILLTSGAAWLFVNNAGNGLFTIEDDATVGVGITGQDTSAGAGQRINVFGGTATTAGQAGGDVVLAGGGISTPGDTFGMVRINSAWALDSTISPAALGAGNNNNYAPTNGAQSNSWRLTPNAAGSTITGITAGQAGRKLEIFNISTTAAITLTNNDTGNSTAANCFLLPNSASLVIPPGGNVSLWYDTTSSRWRLDGSAGTASSTTSTFSQFTAGSNSFTIPQGATYVKVRLYGAGGGGGSGSSVNGQTHSAGAAGGGGACVERTYLASDLGGGGASVSWTVGAGGTGGTGVLNSATGNTGNTGGDSTFSSGRTLCTAFGGGPGFRGGGNAAAGGGGGGGSGSAGLVGDSANSGQGGNPGTSATGNVFGSWGGTGGRGSIANTQTGNGAEWGGGGGGGHSSGSSNPGTEGGASLYGGGGGGCGGGGANTTGGAVYQPYAGGTTGTFGTGGFGGGGAAGTSGAAPTQGSDGITGNTTRGGTGGGGGGGSTTSGVNGQRGGNGGAGGGGGGGGGACESNGTSGAGGNGGDGGIVIWAW